MGLRFTLWDSIHPYLHLVILPKVVISKQEWRSNQLVFSPSVRIHMIKFNKE
jgi:hypothetical protein